MTFEALLHDINHGTSFRHHPDKDAAVMSGEYNLSHNVMSAGKRWSVSSLLLQHEAVDFRNKTEWGCNRHQHPSKAHGYGYDEPGGRISINPLEVLFHKANWHTLKKTVSINAMNK